MKTCPEMSQLALSEGGSELRAHLLECSACRTLARMMAGAGDESAGPMSEACAEVEPLLAALADADLEEDDQRQVEEHLAECARCTAAAAALLLELEGAGALGSHAEGRAAGEEEPEPRAPFQPAVEPDRIAPLQRRRRARVLAASAAVALAAAAALLFFFSRGGGEPAAEERARRSAADPKPASGVVKKPKDKKGQKTAKKPKKAPGKHKADPAEEAKKLPEDPSPEPKQGPDEGTACDEVTCLVQPNKPCCRKFGDRSGRTERGGDSAEVRERLSRSDISRAIAKVRDDVARCADSTDLSRAEKVVMRIEIAPSGRISRASPRQDGELARCVTRAVYRARFPEAQKGMTVNYPFIVRPRSGPSAAALITEAQAAAKSSQFGKALRLCQGALNKQPGDQQAVMVCAIASCNLKSKSGAERYIKQLGSPGKKSMARQICKRNGISVP